MTRYNLSALLTIINLVALASSPKLACEKIFEDLDLYDPSLSITIVERKDQTVRSVMFKNKPDLLKKIQKALTSDKEKADKKSLMTDNGEISESLVINNEDAEVKIGLTTSKSKEVYFFIKIRPKNNNRNAKKTSQNERRTKSKKTQRSKKSTQTQRHEVLNDFDSFMDFDDFVSLNGFNDFVSFNDFNEFDSFNDFDNFDSFNDFFNVIAIQEVNTDDR